MRRVLAMCAATLVTVAVSAATAQASVGKDSKRPTLRVVATSPLTIVGSRFRPGEIVRLVVRSSGTSERRVKVTRAGTFKVVLGTWLFDRCGATLVIQAAAAHSGLMSLKRPQPMCPPPLDGPLGGPQS